MTAFTFPLSTRVRQMTPLVSCLALCLALGACAVSDEERAERRLPTDAEVEQYNASVAPEDRIVCREERGVSSNIPRRVCRYVRDVEELSTFTRGQLRQVLQ